MIVNKINNKISFYLDNVNYHYACFCQHRTPGIFAIHSSPYSLAAARRAGSKLLLFPAQE